MPFDRPATLPSRPATIRVPARPARLTQQPQHAAPRPGHAWRAAALAVCAALLTACASAPPAAPSAGSALATASRWQGRLAMTVDSQPPERLAASFTLEGNAEQGALALFTPLGSTVAQAQWRPQGATLTQGGQVREFASLDELLTHFASAALPVQALFSWLQGQPHDAPGWQVDLSQHASGRITATRQYPLPSVDLRLILN
ncbi:hypothetical protein CCO03_16530 [Comamonas serinivorans]|uniref:Outer-membrane lipoprotein LolB n=1 Tax=Comamonas serinivorans TaxID=1082851 RepID=A0A1Y0EQX3_9BURK|nr:lipoprotein insertase outer membrane protein LolB [Comamonas serinivorans]ARU06057.1 hypothetical protein CCO03_16530 [Comamonas serinivorans]